MEPESDVETGSPPIANTVQRLAEGPRVLGDLGGCEGGPTLIVVGGLRTIHGAFFGAMVVGLLPLLISFSRDGLASVLGLTSITIPGLENGLFGAILIAFILFEPMGIYGRWVKVRTYFELFPFYRRDMFRRQKSYLKTERTR